MENPTKKDLIAAIDKAHQETMAWYENQSNDDFNKEFVAGKWTAAGHLYHLIVTNNEIAKGFGLPKMMLRMSFVTSNRKERTFDQQRQKYKDSLAKIINTTGQGAKPGSKYEPDSEVVYDKSELLKEYQESLTTLLEKIEKQSEEQLSKFVLPHPLMGKLTLREFAYFADFHTQHHLDNLKANYQ